MQSRLVLNFKHFLKNIKFSIVVTTNIRVESGINNEDIIFPRISLLSP